MPTRRSFRPTGRKPKSHSHMIFAAVWSVSLGCATRTAVVIAWNTFIERLLVLDGTGREKRGAEPLAFRWRNNGGAGRAFHESCVGLLSILRRQFFFDGGDECLGHDRVA